MKRMYNNINIEYANAYTEVLEVIKHMSKKIMDSGAFLLE